MRRILLFLFLLCLPGATGGLAASDETTFQQGVAAYDAGDYDSAFEVWLPLAQHGNAAAQRNIGQLYRQGLGVERDAREAAVWYQRAAERGLPAAQTNLAVLYLRGEGVSKDPEQAAHWFGMAARLGHVAAQFNLARMYELGLGVEPDPARAMGWYYVAARNGHGAALERLAALVPMDPLNPPEIEMVPELTPPADSRPEVRPINRAAGGPVQGRAARKRTTASGGSTLAPASTPEGDYTGAPGGTTADPLARGKF